MINECCILDEGFYGEMHCLVKATATEASLKKAAVTVRDEGAFQ